MTVGGTAIGTTERLTVVRDVAGIAEIRDAWLALQGRDITTDPDYYLAGVEGDPKIVRPHLVLLEREGAPHAMLVARVERLQLPVKIGYTSLLTSSVTSVTVVAGGVLGDPDEETFRTLFGRLRRSLAEREADACIFLQLPVESSWHRIVSSEPSFLHRQHLHDTDVHWQLDLPASVEDVSRSMSKGTRSNIKNYSNRLKRDFGETLEIRVFESLDGIDDLFRDVETVAAKTYQRGLGVAFGDTAAHRRRTEVAMERGWFRAYILYAAGKPIAFGYGDRYRGIYRAGRPGYDPEFSNYRPGTHLLMWSIDNLCRDPEVEILDLGVGDAEFKRRFCNRGWDEASVIVYAPRVRPVAINLTRSALLTVIGQGKRLAKRRGAYTSLKRRSRDRLRKAKD